MAGNHDDDLELRKQRLALTFRLIHRLTDAATLVALLYVAQWPLRVIRDTVEPFAGTETIVDANFALSATVTVSIALNGFQAFRSRTQSKEIEHERARINELEATISQLQAKLANPDQPRLA